MLTQPATVIVLLAAVCLGLHYSALSGGWRFDDGPHLYFVTSYSPWQYFFIPEIMRIQSWAHITPWNAFFYEIGLPFFGLNPTGHYAHLLLIVWSIAIATFFLLRLWFTPFSALMGAILFLAMPATGVIGQMLMTGHYAYGLLFSVITFIFFTLAIREDRLLFSLLAAVFYTLACWSKELYVPIIAILLFWPEGNWRNRFRHLFAIVFVALIYTVVRIVVLQRIGGYGNPPLTGSLSFVEIVTGYLTHLWGGGWLGLGVAIYLGASALMAWYWFKLRVNISLMAIGLIVILVPILPMLRVSLYEIHAQRLLFFMGWTLAIFMVWLTHQSKLHTLTLLIVIVALTISQQKTVVHLADNLKLVEQQYRFLTEAGEERFMLPHEFAIDHYYELIRKAAIRLNGINPPRILHNEEQLAGLGKEMGANIYQYDPLCQCMQAMGERRYQDYVDTFRRQLAAGANQELALSFELENQGAKKVFRWQVIATQDNFDLYVPEFSSFRSLPLNGEISFGIDIAGPEGKDMLIYIHVKSSDGWIARSPPFLINTEISNRVTWSGKSAVDWPQGKATFVE